ncbi:hypothetical protein GHR37_04500 [Achromobacter xylosoxidans]|nr:hypothetical protein [Achromobacter xylosoxidans]
MMAWTIIAAVGLVVGAALAVLLRHPGVVLYDWIATRANKPLRQARLRESAERRKPVSQAGHTVLGTARH